MGPKVERLCGVCPGGNQVNCVITPVEAPQGLARRVLELQLEARPRVVSQPLYARRPPLRQWFPGCPASSDPLKLFSCLIVSRRLGPASDTSFTENRTIQRKAERFASYGFQSQAGRAANHFRHSWKYDHTRQEAGLHALRQDHLRRG